MNNQKFENGNNKNFIKIFWGLLIAWSSLNNINSQNIGYITDAIRNTDNMYNSTSRSMSLGNAVSSLGGEFGSIVINPATLGVYQASELVFAPGMLSFANISSYNNSNTIETNTKFSISSLGFILTKQFSDNNDWQSINFAFGYNKTSNLNNFFNIKGTTTNTTLMNEFISNANAKEYYTLDSYFESMAFNLGIIDTVSGSPIQYYSPYQHIPLLQQRNIETLGSIGEYAIAMGANFKRQLYLGFALNIRSGYYEDKYFHREYDIEDQLIDHYYLFNYRLTTNISGWNAKVGMIYRPVEKFRIGLSFHTPTITRINQEMSTSMKVVEDNGNSYNEYPRNANGNIVGNLIDNYNITTPFRTVVGLSYLFEDKGLLSVDYEYADYSAIKLSNADFVEVSERTNEEISNRLKATNNIRLGGEVKLDAFYLRVGYAFAQSPFKKGELNENAHTHTYALGLGYRTNMMFIDIAYSKIQRTEKYYMYDDSNLNPVDLKTNIGNILITAGLRF